ncbi:hypothetical protein HU200_004267 [Digitaria exilis]|uniref:Pectinesterase inhibitor domain-containing protein n=1 Tax=Digitaria exilis TaxID=1010633 RepID=A0A835E8B9_9POAL|nr:hypothetical protein HU200_050979 [Digitaria exilis]KAF8775746.1 hypothetical protein HU200_004267 [Digitaria exilis]
MSLLVPIVVALSLSLTVVVSGECPGARKNMTMEAACREACAAAPSPATRMYQLCMDTLGEVGSPAGSVEKAGEYAYHATWRALWAYLDTMAMAWHFLGNTAKIAAGEEKEAYAFCVGGRYPEAEAAMDRVRNWLPEHCGHDVDGEYKRALRDVEACRDRVAKLASSPLIAMVEADYNRTLMA